MNREDRPGKARRLSAGPLSAALFSLLFLTLARHPPLHAEPLEIVSQQDIGQITVIEAAGDFTLAGSDGMVNYPARMQLTREFYRQHRDEYDFLVIFTNVDVLPAGFNGYFHRVGNDVQGIGIPLVDHAPLFGSSGRLQGIIEMGNAASKELDPLRPGFEETLQILTHEQMHRWGAYVRFINQNGEPSQALLGQDRAHWSSLLDSRSSTLYGNHWLDNGDGTFTSAAPESALANGRGKLFSPLELYLMGIYEADKVPDLLLIDSPATDPNQLPKAGQTISGTATQVTIGDIIAAEGPRVPTAAEAPKNFRTAFIYLARPGTVDLQQVRGLEALRGEWSKRFSILTNGLALLEVRSDLPLNPGGPTNPGVTEPTPGGGPALLASGVDWLIARQQLDGRWEDRPETPLRDTAAALQALRNFTAADPARQAGRVWLAAAPAASTDFLARQLGALATLGEASAALLSRQNADGGWGSDLFYLSNPADTGLVLAALVAAGGAGSEAARQATAYLHARQNADGGWSYGAGSSQLPVTAQVLRSLHGVREISPLEPAIADGIGWVLARQNPDGGFGQEGSTAYETALAVSALLRLGAPRSVSDAALGYLLLAQRADGSWGESAYQTALAVEALWSGQVAVDLAIGEGDITVTPQTLTTLPQEVSVRVTVHNLGSQATSAFVVVLHTGGPDPETTTERTVTLAGNSSVDIVFPLLIRSRGDYEFRVVIDPENRITELCKTNNTMVATRQISLPPPVIGFATAASSALEAAAMVALEVGLSHGWDREVTVAYTVNTASTATTGVDFQLEPGTLTFLPGETAKEIPLVILDDGLVEGEETVVVDLFDPTEAVLGLSRHIVTLGDDDRPPSARIFNPQPGVYPYRTLYLSFEATEGTPTVLVDGEVVNKKSGQALDPLPDGPHMVRLEVSGSAGTAIDEVAFSIDAANSPYPALWSKLLGGYNSTSYPWPAVATDHQGAVYVTGGTAPSYSAPRYPSMAKYDRQGFQHWQVVFITSSEAQASSLAVDYQNNIYMGGNRRIGSSGSEGFIAKYSDRGVPIWSFLFGDSADTLYIASVAVGSDGVYVGGYASGTLNGSRNLGGYDIFLRKYDWDGNLLWSRTWGSKKDDRLESIAIDSSGQVYLAGSTAGALAAGGLSGLNDAFLLKTDANGNLLWGRQFGTVQDETVAGIIVDQGGEVVLAGTTTGSLDGMTVPENGRSLFMVKFDAQGNRQWLKQNNDIRWARAIALHPDGSTLVAGQKGAETWISNGDDLYLIKYGPAGDRLWQRLYMSAYMANVYGVAADPYGNVFLRSGYYTTHDYRSVLTLLGDELDRDPPLLTLDPVKLQAGSDAVTLQGSREAGSHVLVAADSSAAIGTMVYPTETTWSCQISFLPVGTTRLTVTASDSFGNQRKVETSVQVVPGSAENIPCEPLWATQAVRATDGTSSSDEKATDIALGVDGKTYMVGTARGIFSYYEDVWVVSFDEGGRRTFSWAAGSVDADWGKAVAIDPAGKIIVAWQTFSYVSKQVGWSTDIFLGKFDSAGAAAWTVKFGSAYEDEVEDIVIDAGGNIYMTGRTFGAIGRSGYGGEGDYFIAKFDPSGKLLFAKVSGQTGADGGRGLVLDQTGNMYLTGERTAGAFGAVPFVAKFRGDGVLQWSRDILVPDKAGTGSILRPGAGNAIVIGPEGDLFVTGAIDLLAGTRTDLFLARVSDSGVGKWVRTLGTYGAEAGTALAWDGEEGIFVTGTTTEGIEDLPSLGKEDLFVAKFSLAGEKRWVRLVGTAESDVAASILVDPSGDLLLGGHTFGVIGETDDLVPNGRSDFFLMKLVPGSP
ncbi:MAG: hypothetical protein IH614_19715 [Desulfuromonadales bacterium]|nr:hypothetical protein [Desulfuromonadales bacterium]